MIDPRRPIRALVAALRQFFSRRAARKLEAQALPVGLRAAPRPLRLALRIPLALDDAPAGEFWTLPLGAQAIRGQRPSLLLRLRALPPPLRRIDGLRTPLARAPLHRLRLRNFRLDPRTGQPANEGIVPLAFRDTTFRWVLPAFRREKVDLPWMARERVAFLGPLQCEWFLRWWDADQALRPGAKDPYPYDLAPELGFALEAVKEQMLIRRDVKKDENPPQEQEFYFIEVGPPMAALDTPPIDELVPQTEWVERAAPIGPALLDPPVREAYLQWRTLVDALEER